MKTRGGAGAIASSHPGQGVTGNRRGAHAGGQRAESGRSGRAVVGVCRCVVGDPGTAPGMQSMAVPLGCVLGWGVGRQ